jgi:hypothetical protein|tara:strand:- start:1393 stop:1710 length:318 start_codon:yes stop_codon:yes gene_type:complete
MMVERQLVEYYYGDMEDYSIDIAEGKNPVVFRYGRDADEFLENLYKYTHFSWLCKNVDDMKRRLVRRYEGRAKDEDLSTNTKFRDWLLRKRLVIKIPEEYDERKI